MAIRALGHTPCHFQGAVMEIQTSSWFLRSYYISLSALLASNRRISHGQVHLGLTAPKAEGGIES
jgi:hypothetical protein